MMQQYKVDVLNLIEQAGSVRSDCGDITFYNAGTSIVVINSALRLTPGNSITITANKDEIDRTIYTYFFDGAGSRQFVVFRKIYI
jgi:hypothetical protein